MFSISKIEPRRIGRMGLAVAAMTVSVAGWSGEAAAGFAGWGGTMPPSGFNGVSLNGIKANGVETNDDRLSGEVAASSVRLPNGTVLTIVAPQER